MRAYEKQLTLKTIPENRGLLEYLSKEVSAFLSTGSHPIRFVVTKSDQHSYYVELGVLALPEIAMAERSQLPIRRNVIQRVGLEAALVRL